MDKVSGKLTVFFEAPFWVEVFERISFRMIIANEIGEVKWQRTY